MNTQHAEVMGTGSQMYIPLSPEEVSKQVRRGQSAIMRSAVRQIQPGDNYRNNQGQTKTATPGEWTRTYEDDKLRTAYLINLNLFEEDEEKGIRQYEELLSKVAQSLSALSPDQIAARVALIEMQRRISRILEEERTHLEAIKTLREIF